ncbi:protein of unknown function [Thermococcus nautili]|uniref:hypothetical protein n=1 Tax=Thermococcus nautili TaxID=195522 RepID=UPI002556D03B|nr:hypothetical protein [Thermococcus nautili]CAI1492355.1 protein of unknown function [Thermococcus nautili]
MRGHPMLHDFFSSILDYKSEEVYRLLKKLDLLEMDYRIDFIRKECPIHIRDENQKEYTVFSDVVWILDTGDYAIIHEIKTGNYSIQKIYNKYHGSTIKIKTKKLEYNIENVIIYVWAWSEYHQENLDSISEPGKVGWWEIKLIPLEILIPIAQDSMKDMLDIFIKNVGYWNPKEDYVKKLKLKIWNTLWRDILNDPRMREALSHAIPSQPNVIIEYEREEDEDIDRDFELLRGSFPPSVLGSKIINAYVPVTCKKCHSTYLLQVDMEEVYSEEREMGKETQWAISYEGWCPICGSPINLEIDVWEYPLGIVEDIVTISNHGLVFPTKDDINKLINR